MSKEYEQTRDECPICLDIMGVGIVLRCGHVFHEKCIESWKLRNESCPICRTPLKEQTIPWWMHCWFIYKWNQRSRVPSRQWGI